MARDVQNSTLNKNAILLALPDEWPTALLSSIASRVSCSNTTVVVLDDDPTGTQTVYDLPVLTEWTAKVLEEELHRGTPAFYVLTNSRSLTPEAAATLYEDVALKLLAASRKYGRELEIVSRSDSTLRGHYPLEIEVLWKVFRGHGNDKKNIDGILIIPFFVEGGRVTIDDVHYVIDGEQMVPAAQTQFAKDRAFGFTKSNLKDYVQEKSDNKIHRDDILSISLDDLRSGGPSRVEEKLKSLSDGQTCVVNGVSIRDAEVFVWGMLNAEERHGKKFFVRSAASYVQARLGLAKRPLLDANVINHEHGNAKEKNARNPRRGGLIVVGSYVPKTSKQLELLLRLDNVTKLELEVSALLHAGKRAEILRSALRGAEAAMSGGRHAVVYTSRTLVTGATATESLSIGNAVSEGIVAIVSGLSEMPKFIIAKGGITSSDVATKGLNIKRAIVLGQAAPGVPVWKIGEEGKFPGMSYVVFPGNVGGDDELVKLVSRLST